MLKLDAFTRAYIECMLWSTSAEIEPYTDQSYSDHGYDAGNFPEEELARIVTDCDRFQSVCGDVITDDEQAGHDFWLDRVGHGAGALDRDCECEERHLGSHCPVNILRHACAQWLGSVDLYTGDDGNLYQSPDPFSAAMHARRLDRRECEIVDHYLNTGELPMAK